jgi:hypothetical protein
MNSKPNFNKRYKPYNYNAIKQHHANPYDVPINDKQDTIVILNDGVLGKIKNLEVPNTKTIVSTIANGTIVDFYKAVEAVDSLIGMFLIDPQFCSQLYKILKQSFWYQIHVKIQIEYFGIFKIPIFNKRRFIFSIL